MSDTPRLVSANPEIQSDRLASRISEKILPPPDRPDPPDFTPQQQKILEALRENSPASISLPEIIPARMLNEFVYCPRLFHYEHVQGLFLDNADTARGTSLHTRVDAGSGTLPPPIDTTTPVTSTPQTSPVLPLPLLEPETIHSRSVSLGSERLGVTAKLDLVESTLNPNDLFPTLETCPVEYKAGAPRTTDEGNQLWDADKIQLGLQILLLRENGYSCNQGIIYYRATKQRVTLPYSPELEDWIHTTITQAHTLSHGPIPPPLIDSPKCTRCSLAPICLPDETHYLATTPNPPLSISPTPRRLIATRNETRALYLNTPGLHVGCTSGVLRVKSKDQILEEIRITDLQHISLFGNIQITTQTIHILCEENIPLTYFSMGGWFYGLSRGHSLKNIHSRIAQFRRADDPLFCLTLAQQFVHGKIRNHRTLLMRNHTQPPPETLLRLKRAADDALTAPSLPSLLGIEGAAAAEYFAHLSGMLKNSDHELPGLALPEPTLTFDFTTRNRRPPTDPVNAMLSLAYSLLAKDATIALLSCGLDPYLGFYHQPRAGRPALALDLMEEFRPLIAESTVLSIVNNRMLKPQDFITAGHSVNLTPAGRKTFFLAYEKRMQSTITHPLFDYKVSYRRALELQARILMRTLEGEIPHYAPFLTR